MRRWLTYVAILISTLGVRKLLGHLTNGFDEYEAFFIYLSDLILIAPIAIVIQKKYLRLPQTVLIGFIGFAFISIFSAFSTSLAIYSFVRLFLAVLAAVSVAILIQKEFLKKEWILGGLAIAAVVQSVIGVGQFIFQKSLGLFWLGEPVIGPDIGGAAKIVVEEVRILRAYGTFPHPNVLAAFLLLGLISLCYFWLRRPIVHGKAGILSDLKIGAAIFVVALGLVVAFSRSAWLVGGIILVILLAKEIFSKENFRQAPTPERESRGFRNDHSRLVWGQGVRLAIFLIPIVSLLFLSFRIYTFPRAAISVNEPAVTQRISYNQLAFELIKSRPLGVGIGNQVLYSVKNEVYKNMGMTEVWQWQPIHNIYLLIASEIGIIGLISFLVFLGYILHRNFKDPILTAMVECVLLLGFFDHYLWTLQPGRIMLWLTIGLILSLNRSESARS